MSADNEIPVSCVTRLQWFAVCSKLAVTTFWTNCRAIVRHVNVIVALWTTVQAEKADPGFSFHFFVKLFEISGACDNVRVCPEVFDSFNYRRVMYLANVF